VRPAVVRVEHLTAEVFHDTDGSGTHLGDVLNHENENRFSGQLVLLNATAGTIGEK